MKKFVDSYDVFFEGVAIPISIYEEKEAFIPTYDVGVLKLGKYSQVIVKKIKEDLLREGVLDSFSKKDGATYEEIKEAYMSKIKELLHYYLPNITFDERSKILTIILQTSFDLGYIDILINDPGIEEITVNGSESKVMVYHRKYGWLHTNLNFNDDSEIRNISSRIAMENKKFFTNLNPLLDAHLIGGHRVNATLSPISTKGTTLTIRRFSDTPWTVCDLIRSGTSTPIGLAIIWLAIENEFSIIVVGGTGSGKTSFLNAISGFIPASQRIISVEDTREIRLPEYAHWVPMESRAPNQEGKGQISMLDLIVNSLRMRPDRIIIGEIRKKEEAEVLFEAMRTGHSVYGTFHANTADEAMMRLTSSPIEIPKISLNSLGLIVVQHRDRKSGRRITLQIAEMDGEGNSRVIFQFNHKANELEMKQKPIYLLKKLDEFQGIDSNEFLEEIKHRAWMLNALSELGAKNITQVGKYINKYQTNKETLLKNINTVFSNKYSQHKNKQTIVKESTSDDLLKQKK